MTSIYTCVTLLFLLPYTAIISNIIKKGTQPMLRQKKCVCVNVCTRVMFNFKMFCYCTNIVFIYIYIFNLTLSAISTDTTPVFTRTTTESYEHTSESSFLIKLFFFKLFVTECTFYYYYFFIV